MSSLQTLVSVRCHDDSWLLHKAGGRCVHHPGLHVDDHGGVFLAVLQLAVHLTPGAPHAETGSGDVLTVGALPKKK